MKSVNISIKYSSSVAVTKFVCKEIRQKNHFTLLQEKERKLLYSRYSFFIPFNEQKCHVTNIYTERKNKYHITLFCKKRKVSYYITFFQTLLRTFFVRPLFSDRRIILSYCDWKESTVTYVCKKNNIFLSTNNESDMLQIFTL